MDLTILLGTLIIVLASALTVLVALKRPFNAYIDIMIVILCITLVAYALGRSEEHFSGADANTTTNGNTLDKMLASLNMQTASTSASGSASASVGNENLTLFSNGLTLYYSAFSIASFPQTARKLYNISPYFASSSTSSCPDISMKDTHMYFSDVPSYTRSTGFLLGKNKVIGPKSHQLGIAANDSFSIAFAISFDNANGTHDVHTAATATSTAPSSDPIEIIKLYANTVGNNGISITMDPTTHSLSLGFGDSITPLQMQLPSSSLSNTVYIFTIVKSGSNLTVNVYPNVADLSSTPQMKTTAAQIVLGNDSDILLSNKEIRINGSGNTPAHLFCLAFWNKAIPDFTMADFYLNVQAELQKNNEMLKSLAGQISDLKKKLTQGKQCPYDDATCGACTNVVDWTNMSDVIMNAGEECRSKINAFCTANPSNKNCSCWNTSSLISSTSQCSSYRSMFGEKVDDNLDEDALERIKGTYNLCTCPIKTIAVPAAVSLPSPRPSRTIIGAYTTKSSDLDVYNAIKT